MMRRSLKGFFKFVGLGILTIITTVVIFRQVRPPKDITGNSNKGVNPIPPPEKFVTNVNIKEDFYYYTNAVRPKSTKIDWHNYKQIEEDKARSGNGEQGKAATLPPHITAEEKENLYKTNGFNALLSDNISLNRSLPDIRKKGCQKKKYLAELPSVSVIVPFHNEHWSTLLRTAWSVINRSPAHLLKEIILVDDFSSKEHCKKPLDDYVAAHLPKVKVIHLPKRDGLIRARLAGARVATGEVLIFLDSHTEANVNWLPPLLEPIAEDYRTCVCPLIDVIAYETFEYRAQDEGGRGAFDWEFYYKRLPLLPEDLRNPTEPFKSPVMAGGLFAISTKFFWELGGYDPGLNIWGGEQYELSFKIWQCGGRMFDAPCSRVGHIYRKFAPFPNPGIGDFVGKNYRRVAEVWMDEYAEYLYKRRPQYRSIDPGDLTEQKAIRERLHCRPFRWFMEEVAFDLVKKYPPVEPPDFGYGEVPILFHIAITLLAIMLLLLLTFSLRKRRLHSRKRKNFNY
ncbi:N-acetylgalactosaminyltransferase 6-like isoform X2 [Homalodisca vitripennis]|uniref:N-acetylgalactosaminyltransferase 6-like isoform X2 n=1 Tax=Homalodisca vitripennis TaxID=197043 RepID=UPI001EE9CC9F|nr:N-acetylgalactosaminyltransferase 6-like isoform X2 [Homalodisca vitripennis]